MKKISFSKLKTIQMNRYIQLCLTVMLVTLPMMAQKAPDRTLCDYRNHVNAQASARRTATGIVIAGEGTTLRAFETFNGTPDGGTGYAAAINRYCRVLGDSVRVYSMVVPRSLEFYCPDQARKWTHRERPVIANIYAHLSPSVRVVNVYNVLASHVDDPIYSRTDHHWAPLGAYYAAREFARVADVPFDGLDQYEPRVVRNYVGTMYKFSKDAAVKASPEDFIYYVHRDSNYTTRMIKYEIDRQRKPVKEVPECDDIFFRHYEDGSAAAYCAFMGGDVCTTIVRTDVGNGRRLMIIKDSFGNALPGYLFHSFEEIVVVDFRYFLRDVAQFAREHHITDLLFANNLGHAYNPTTAQGLEKILK